MKSKTIGTAFNTFNPCLLILRDKGYGLKIINATRKDGSVTVLYEASRGDWKFVADSGPELLGLVVLHETYGDDWNRSDPDIIADLVVHVNDDDSAADDQDLAAGN